MNRNETGIYRVIDANLNRLREALRVLEEYFRFFMNSEFLSIKLKELRHGVKRIESSFPDGKLVSARDSENDVFAFENRPEELERDSLRDLLLANIKRSQEASRVLEEYLKISSEVALSQTAKKMRFFLYTFEKEVMENFDNE